MEKINRLRKFFKLEKIDGYIIPKNDEFFGEYTPKNNDRLNYISNFSGSYGFALILKKKNYLFVDGRYTLQAKLESGKNFEIKLLSKDLLKNIFNNKAYKIGFDPKLFTRKVLNILFKKSSCKLISINNNLIDNIWKRKKNSSNKKFYSLPTNVVGHSYKEKIEKNIKYLKDIGVDFHFITASENCSWLLNIRGQDSKYTPITHGYILLDVKKNVNFFCNLKKINSTFKKKFKNINFIDIKLIKIFLSKIENKKFILDKNTCSVFLEKFIMKNNKILDYNDPIYLLKSVKTKKEIENIKKAHVYDGVALTKYLFWLKNNYLKKKITEISAEEKLYSFRKKNRFFKCLSFPTISAAGPNGAIIHYRASFKSNRVLKKGEIYLVDSGGQYNFGTTDVTRTISLNNLSSNIKNIFTRVLKGHIAVSNFQFKKKTDGSIVDKAARKYLQQINLDYPHGTGHGVGYFLNVHEGPHAISKNNKVRFIPGIVISNEPGFYKKGKYGIRIENLIYLKKNKSKMFFEDLTMVPIEKNLIEKSLLKQNEKKWINNYHKKVFNRLQKFMNRAEVIELKKACSAI